MGARTGFVRVLTYASALVVLIFLLLASCLNRGLGRCGVYGHACATDPSTLKTVKAPWGYASFVPCVVRLAILMGWRALHQ